MIENLDNKTYRIETIVIEENAPNYFTQKKYARNVEIYYLGKNRKNGHFIFQLLTVEFDFSNDDNAMAKFTKKMSYLFDELELEVNNEGIILNVININSLRLRWLDIETQLSKEYKGDAVERYFNQIADLLESEEKLINFLEDYKMLGLLFHGLWNAFESKWYQRISKNGTAEIMIPRKRGGLNYGTRSRSTLFDSSCSRYKEEEILPFQEEWY